MTAQNYAKSFINSQDFKFIKLAGDAGSRIYYRIGSATETFILLDYSNDKDSIHDFLNIKYMLSNENIPCPKLIEHDEKNCFVVLEDLTDYSLEEAFNSGRYKKYYSQAISNLAKLHNITSPIRCVEQRAFDYDKLYWEMNFAIKHLNQLYNISDTSTFEELSDICKNLGSLPRVVCHRDFHSRNLIIKNDQLFFIDFQDARMGPWQYDVVSLLHDSYVNLSQENTDQLLKEYLSHINFKIDENWKQDYNIQLIQRTFKACGSFASLKNIKGTNRYLQYLPKCYDLLISKSGDLPAFNKYIQLLLKLNEELKT